MGARMCRKRRVQDVWGQTPHLGKGPAARSPIASLLIGTIDYSVDAAEALFPNIFF